MDRLNTHPLLGKRHRRGLALAGFILAILPGSVLADPIVSYDGVAIAAVFGNSPEDVQGIQTGGVLQPTYSNSVSASVNDPATGSILSAGATGTAALFHLAASGFGKAATQQAYEASADGNLDVAWGDFFIAPPSPLPQVDVPWSFTLADSLSVSGANPGNSAASAIAFLRIEYDNIFLVNLELTDATNAPLNQHAYSGDLLLPEGAGFSVTSSLHIDAYANAGPYNFATDIRGAIDSEAVATADFSFANSAAPEPASLTLLGLGVFALAGYARRCRANRSCVRSA
jgi:hypothetical protein